LPNYDYSKAGTYFITICVHDHECVFGHVVNGEMILSVLGQFAHDCWVQIPQHFNRVALDEFIIMPNHVHGIIIIRDLMENESSETSLITNQPTNNQIPALAPVLDIPVGNAYMRSLRVPVQPQPLPPNENTKPNDPTKMLIPKIIQQYKAAVTRANNQSPVQPPFRWQKSYYDHIIRNPFSLARIQIYIRNNPVQWQNDLENLKKSSSIHDYFNVLPG
jgi:REP element-mobilizing transposase RayT